MTEKDLKKMGRTELLEILLKLAEENDRLKKEQEELREQLASREILYSKAGTLAEAAVAANRLLEAADASARQYLENVKKNESFYEDQKNRIIGEARLKAEQIEQMALARSARIHKEADEYWNTISRLMERFSSNYQSMKDDIALQGIDKTKPY